MPTDWRETDERLIRRGELILELGFVQNNQAELGAMNHGKEGRPYKLTPTYIQFITAVTIENIRIGYLFQPIIPYTKYFDAFFKKLNPFSRSLSSFPSCQEYPS